MPKKEDKKAPKKSSVELKKSEIVKREDGEDILRSTFSNKSVTEEIL